MQKTSIFIITTLLLLISLNLRESFSQSDVNAREEKIDELLEEMSVAEKVGQMTQLTLATFTKRNEDGELIEPLQLDKEKIREAVVDYNVGSILNTDTHANNRKTWHKIISHIQKLATEETSHSIPVLYGIDAIHGVNYTAGATLFPQQIAQGATFNASMVKKVASISAYETRASAIPWTFSPVLGVGRQPVWSRFWETFGEDTYVANKLGKALVKGYQGDDISDTTKVAACMKHFLAYSAPETGKDRTPVRLSERRLREIYLPPFREAVNAGVATAMINSGEINGIPVHTEEQLLTDMLKEELEFKGLAVTDWHDIVYLHTRHKIAETQKEAVKIAVNAGVDMSMVPFDYSFYNHLTELVKEGEVPESRINDAVRRILRVKFQLGLFETPVTHYKGYNKFASEEFQETNLKAAQEAITLLKNKDNTLPLSKDTKVLVTGPTANSMISLNGAWSYSWQGDAAEEFAKDKQTVLEAVKQTAGEKNVSYAKGSNIDTAKNIGQARNLAKESDHIILCLGEKSYTERPGDIKDLTLPDAQIKLAKQMAKTGKPVTLVLVEGRPRIINDFEEQTDAIVMAYLPGNQGGKAISDVIFGEVNPSGKLPFTYPKHPNDLIKYDHKHTEELNYPNGKSSFNPQFEFGTGLSYTTYTYKDLSLSSNTLTENGSLTVSVEVANTGDRAGKETVLLYTSDHYASITPSVKKLKKFKKIQLDAGETKNAEFTITPGDLEFVNKDNERVTEKGTFSVLVKDMEKEFTFE